MFTFLLHTVLYLTITEICIYKHSTVGSLSCLSCKIDTEHHTTFCRIQYSWFSSLFILQNWYRTSYNVLQNNKAVFTVYLKYTLADVTLFWPLKLGNTTLILYMFLLLHTLHSHVYWDTLYISQTLNSVLSNNLSLKYPRFTPSDCKNKWIRKIKLVTRAQFLYKIWQVATPKSDLRLKFL